MPKDAVSSRDILAETMSDGRKAVVPYLAEMMRRESKIAEVPPDEERTRFWQRALTPEQEAQLWASEMQARGITTLTPEQATDIGLKIGSQVYPDRFDMMGQEGRTTQAQQARWAWKHMQAGPPKAMQEGEQDGVEN